MKIAVISVSNIYCMPYYYKYEKLICDNSDGFDLIFWNRALIEESVDPKVNKISFDTECTYNDKDKKKIFKFFAFYRFVKKQLRTKKYDKVFILGTYSLLTFFLQPFLSKHYNKNFWLDIRDYTYEHIKMFYNREKKLIDSSYVNFISSEAYKNFLPDGNFKMAHNIDNAVIDDYFSHNSESENEDKAIRISFIGNVRYIEQNKKLIEMFANDERYLLQYFGGGSEQIEEISKEIGAKNVICEGRFKHTDTYKYYLRTDMINNLYGNSGIELTTALSNKLYFAAAFRIPILVSPNTYMEDISKRYNFGFCVDFDNPNVPDQLYDWYKNEFEASEKTKDFVDMVNDDEKEFSDSIKEYLRD